MGITNYFVVPGNKNSANVNLNKFKNNFLSVPTKHESSILSNLF